MSRADMFRVCFGLLLVTILGGLIAAIALGHVEEKTSYGLMPLIVAVSNLATQFATYAFAKSAIKSSRDGEIEKLKAQIEELKNVRVAA